MKTGIWQNQYILDAVLSEVRGIVDPAGMKYFVDTKDELYRSL